jgi:hypothetical protein
MKKPQKKLTKSTNKAKKSPLKLPEKKPVKKVVTPIKKLVSKPKLKVQQLVKKPASKPKLKAQKPAKQSGRVAATKPVAKTKKAMKPTVKDTKSLSVALTKVKDKKAKLKPGESQLLAKISKKASKRDDDDEIETLEQVKKRFEKKGLQEGFIIQDELFDAIIINLYLIYLKCCFYFVFLLRILDTFLSHLMCECKNYQQYFLILVVF